MNEVFYAFKNDRLDKKSYVETLLIFTANDMINQPLEVSWFIRRLQKFISFISVHNRCRIGWRSADNAFSLLSLQ
ncbi:hypothetical protein AU255_12930 [Methyloprofundus sedimenti]|uniref:Uncharacterized protein n=1 Tax=Methyloprofundus sedimenti TaxID=1420851 RepID=A0A1V8M384_9GAMM|nr:hypothetical protein AU255_12930 [Methyloprofundus sedimenti]